MSGRSEQVNIRRGVSSTYACYNCCPDSIYSDGTPTPFSVERDIGTEQYYGFQAATRNCYGGDGFSFIGEGYNWSSSNYSIAQITYGGTATAIDEGTSYLTGYFENVIWQSGILGCHSQNEIVYGSSEIEVRPSVGIDNFKAVGKNQTVKVKVTIGNNPNSQDITLTIAPNSGTTGAAQFTSNNSTTRTIRQTEDVEIKGMTESSTKDNMRLKASFKCNSLDDPVTNDAAFQ